MPAILSHFTLAIVNNMSSLQVLVISVENKSVK